MDAERTLKGMNFIGEKVESYAREIWGKEMGFVVLVVPFSKRFRKVGGQITSNLARDSVLRSLKGCVERMEKDKPEKSGSGIILRQ